MPTLQQAEVTSTALSARELDRFLFFGVCLHQLPVSCSSASCAPERADFYIVQLGTDKLPKRPIAVSDYKNTEFPQACIEIFSYSTRLMEKRFEDDNYAVQLVFPATREWISWSYI